MSPISMTLRRRPPTEAPSTLGSARRVTCPPSLRFAPESIWRRAMYWLLAPEPLDAAPAPSGLAKVREEFHLSIADLTVVPDAGDLVRRVEHARSLRELWHLRAEIYRLIALQHSQAEAELRLTQLNRHFPTRSPGSAFTPL